MVVAPRRRATSQTASTKISPPHQTPGGNRQVAIRDHAQTGREEHEDQRVLAPAVRHGSQSFVRHAASPALPAFASGSVQVCPRRIRVKCSRSTRSVESLPASVGNTTRRRAAPAGPDVRGTELRHDGFTRYAVRRYGESEAGGGGMDYWQGKVVMITGGAAGLGGRLATHFAAAGAKLLLADIHAVALESTTVPPGKTGDSGSGSRDRYHVSGLGRSAVSGVG